MTSLFDLPFEEPEPEPPAAEPERPVTPVPVEPRVLTVSQLTTTIRLLLEEQFAEIWVEGELSNCRVWNTGHMYFTLKDAAAQIKGVMFRSTLPLPSALRADPAAQGSACPKFDCSEHCLAESFYACACCGAVAESPWGKRLRCE